MGVLESRVVIVGIGGSQNSCQLHAVVGRAQSPLLKAWCSVPGVRFICRRVDEGNRRDEKKARYRQTEEARSLCVDQERKSCR